MSRFETPSLFEAPPEPPRCARCGRVIDGEPVTLEGRTYHDPRECPLVPRSAATGNRPGLVAREHGDTAQAAARAVAPRSGTMRARVYEAILAHGEHGVTDAELEAELGIAYTRFSPRRRELVSAGLVIATDRRRLSPFGLKQVVWAAVPLREAP